MCERCCRVVLALYYIGKGRASVSKQAQQQLNFPPSGIGVPKVRFRTFDGLMASERLVIWMKNVPAGTKHVVVFRWYQR